MKKIISLSLLLYSHLCMAQKHDNIWMFSHTFGIPDETELNFSTDPPSLSLVHREMFFSATNATLCDEEGNLLAYTNGTWIADKNGQMMENADSINPGFWADNFNNTGYPALQGAFFLPMPGDTQLFYLIHAFFDIFPGVPGSAPITKIYYSLIDFSYNGGLGKVLEKNIPLLSGGENFNFNQATAVRHANGRDWWILVPNHMEPTYYRFLLNPNGIAGPWEQQNVGFNETTTDFYKYSFGHRVFSPDGSRFADYEFIHNIQVYHFDRCTGLLSNPDLITLPEPPALTNNGASGLAFSPSGRFLYCTRVMGNIIELLQYDLQAADVALSETILTTCNTFSLPICGLVQPLLGPDGKIYITTADTNSLSLIHHPDLPGTLCEFEYEAITYPVDFPNTNLPYFPNYRLYDLPDSPCDTLGINSPPVSALAEADKNEVKLSPNPTSTYIQLHFNQPAPPGALLHLHDLAGRTVLTEKLPPGATQHEVSVVAVPPGMYFYTLIFKNEKRWAGKIVVQR